MSHLTHPVTNRLLEFLPANVRNELLKQCTLVEWKFGDIICEANQIYEHVYFPITGIISLLTVVDEHHPLEMGLIGNEGMLGVCLVLSVNNASLQSVVQGSGTALSIPVDQFRRALLDFPDLSKLLLRYVYVLKQQLVLAGACLHFHEVEPRLARWLLMTQDRAQRDRLYLTHVFLAKMLGVRRSSVSLAAAVLQKQHLIDYCRGNIRILDRKGLEAVSCQCYQSMTESYLRVMG
jgi:CRP-like cAMP-binding protein